MEVKLGVHWTIYLLRWGAVDESVGDRRGKDVDPVAPTRECSMEGVRMPFHPTRDGPDRPLTGEDRDTEGEGWSRGVTAKGEAVPGELCYPEVARPRLSSKGVAERGGGGDVEEKQSWNGEENDEQEGDEEVGMKHFPSGGQFLEFVWESHSH